MQDAGNENAGRFRTIEENVFTVLVSPQAGTNVVTGTSQGWIVRQSLATSLEFTDVPFGLGNAPLTYCELANAQKVRFRTAGQAKFSHLILRHELP